MTVKNLYLIKYTGDVLVEGVTFGYNPDKTILKDVSIFAHPGQKIALVGSTGAGKTTITNLITRFYNINKGKITIDGVDIKDISLECLRETSRWFYKIHICLQAQLWKISVTADFRLPMKKFDRRRKLLVRICS